MIGNWPRAQAERTILRRSPFLVLEGALIQPGPSTLARTLAKIGASEAGDQDMGVIRHRLHTTVADRSRCFLASQQQASSKHPPALPAGTTGLRPAVEPVVIAELLDIRGGTADYDERHLTKQPDWTYNSNYSGTVPDDIRRGSTPPWRL